MTTFTELQLRFFIETAKLAYYEEWYAPDCDGGGTVVLGNGDGVCSDDSILVTHQPNFDHIANMDPPNTVAICEELLRLRFALTAIRDQDEPQFPTGTWAAEVAKDALEEPKP